MMILIMIMTITTTMKTTTIIIAIIIMAIKIKMITILIIILIGRIHFYIISSKTQMFQTMVTFVSLFQIIPAKLFKNQS